MSTCCWYRHMDGSVQDALHLIDKSSARDPPTLSPPRNLPFERTGDDPSSRSVDKSLNKKITMFLRFFFQWNLHCVYKRHIVKRVHGRSRKTCGKKRMKMLWNIMWCKKLFFSSSYTTHPLLFLLNYALSQKSTILDDGNGEKKQKNQPLFSHSSLALNKQLSWFAKSSDLNYKYTFFALLLQ